MSADKLTIKEFEQAGKTFNHITGTLIDDPQSRAVIMDNIKGVYNNTLEKPALIVLKTNENNIKLAKLLKQHGIENKKKTSPLKPQHIRQIVTTTKDKEGRHVIGSPVKRTHNEQEKKIIDDDENEEEVLKHETPTPPVKNRRKKVTSPSEDDYESDEDYESDDSRSYSRSSRKSQSPSSDSYNESEDERINKAIERRNQKRTNGKRYVDSRDIELSDDEDTLTLARKLRHLQSEVKSIRGLIEKK